MAAALLYARVVRGKVLSVKQREYAQAAAARGVNLVGDRLRDVLDPSPDYS